MWAGDAGTRWGGENRWTDGPGLTMGSDRGSPACGLAKLWRGGWAGHISPAPRPPFLSQGKQGLLSGGSHHVATVAPLATEPMGQDPFPEIHVHVLGVTHTRLYTTLHSERLGLGILQSALPEQ